MMKNDPPIVKAIFTNTLEEYLQTYDGKNSVNKQHWDIHNPYRTPLHVVCGLTNDSDSLKTIQLLLSHGANANTRDSKNRLPIEISMKEGKTEIVKLLFNHTILHSTNEKFLVACCTGDILLLKQAQIFCDINQVNLEDGITPLILAIRNKSLPAVEFLVKNHAIINPIEEPSEIENSDGEMLPNTNKPNVFLVPLHEAIMRRYIPVVQFLLNSGCYVTKEAMKIAQVTGEAMMELLLEKADDSIRASVEQEQVQLGNNEVIESPIIQSSDYPLHDACSIGDIGSATEIINRGYNVNTTNQNYETPLHIAVTSGRLDMVAFLLEYSEDINVVQRRKYTPLHIAVSRGYEEIVDLLLQHDATVNIQNDKGETPLHTACNKKYEGIVKLLVDNVYTGVNIQSQAGMAAIHVASSQAGMGTILKILLERKEIDFKLLDKKTSKSPIFMAYKTGDTEMINMLTTKGASLDDPEPNGDTPLFNAFSNQDYNTANFLIESGANIHYKTKYGKSLLTIAVRHSKLDYIDYLIDLGVEINSNEDGSTLLLMAVQAGNAKLVSVLLENKVNPNIPDREGKTPLFHACIDNQVSIAQTLAKNGATFGELEKKPVVKSTYGAKTLTDAKSTAAGQAVLAIISEDYYKQDTPGEEKVKDSKKSKLLSIFSKK